MKLVQTSSGFYHPLQPISMDLPFLLSTPIPLVIQCQYAFLARIDITSYLECEQSNHSCKRIVTQRLHRVIQPLIQYLHCLCLVLQCFKLCSTAGRHRAAVQIGKMRRRMGHDGIKGSSIRKIQWKPDISHGIEIKGRYLVEHHSCMRRQPCSQAKLEVEGNVCRVLE